MSDAATMETTEPTKEKGEVLREKKIEKSKQRIENAAIALRAKFETLVAAVRASSGILDEAKAQKLGDMISLQSRTLDAAMLEHVSAPVPGTKRKAKEGFSLF